MKEEELELIKKELAVLGEDTVEFVFEKVQEKLDAIDITPQDKLDRMLDQKLKKLENRMLIAIHTIVEAHIK